MEAYRKSPLHPGVRCLIIKSGTYGDFRGREVTLVRNYPQYHDENGTIIFKDYWETSPPLRGPAGPDGAIRRLKFSSDGLMCLQDAQVNMRLVIERREECKSDPRMAYYILGKDAAYNQRPTPPESPT